MTAFTNLARASQQQDKWNRSGIAGVILISIALVMLGCVATGQYQS